MRLVFVIPSLSGGGAERVLVSLVKGLAAQGHLANVVTIYGHEYDFFRLPEGVQRVALGLGRDTVGVVDKLWTNLRRLAALRRAIRAARPDAVISFLGQTNVLTLFAAAGLPTPVIVSEHTDPFREPLPEPWQRLRRLAYRRAACVVSVNAAIDGYFDWIPAARRAVIPNPVDLAELASPAPALDWPWPHAAIGMGRLAPEKGFDRLIESFAQLAGEFSDWGLVILGEGPLRSQLESLVARRGLTGRVLLPGGIPQPGPTLKKADLFVLSSRWEALPMALLEAMACGLPSVATQCMGVMPDWLRSGENTILAPVDDVPKLTAALAALMRDAGLRRRLGDNAAETVRPFALESVVKHWEALLAQVGCGPGRGSV